MNGVAVYEPETLTVLETLGARPGFRNHLNPTKRGWLFLGKSGGPCDQACAMCYYTYQEQLTFFSLDTLIAHANLYRHHYGLAYCDISGGEATILGPKKDGRRPHLERLVKHCADIGLAPTIISHGQNNTPELVKGVEGAGLSDWLISLHGMAAGHERTVVNHAGKGDGGWDRLTANLAHCARPVRFNTTLQDFNYRELPELARWLGDHREPTVWNLINFNPFFKWGTKDLIDFQARQSDMAPYVGTAVAYAEARGWEVNLRYFAPCIAEPHGFARNCVGFYGTQVDHWEWSLAATNKAKRAQAPDGWHAWNLAYCDDLAESRANPACRECALFKVTCEGVDAQYQRRFGIEELTLYAKGI